MRAVKLESKTMEEYLLKIKGYVDERAGVGMLVRHEEHVDALLGGLPYDYSFVVSVIESKKCPPSIAEIEALLYGHESRLTSYAQESQSLALPSINYTQSSSSYGRGGFRPSPGTFSCIGHGGRFANFQC